MATTERLLPLSCPHRVLGPRADAVYTALENAFTGDVFLSEAKLPSISARVK